MYSIRIATLSDLPTLRGLWKAFVTELAPPYPENVASGVDTFTRQLAVALARQPAEAFAFLAELEGDPIGFLLYEIQARAFGTPQRYGFVHYLYVTPEGRTEGVAEALTEMACEHGLAQGLTHGEITHQPGQQIWERYGFHDYEVRAHAPIAVMLARLDRRRAKRAADQANGLDHDALLPVPVPEKEER